MIVFPCLEVGVLFSWLWVEGCDLAGIKKLGWYSVGRVRVSRVLNRSSQAISLQMSRSGKIAVMTSGRK